MNNDRSTSRLRLGGLGAATILALVLLSALIQAPLLSPGTLGEAMAMQSPMQSPIQATPVDAPKDTAVTTADNVDSTAPCTPTPRPGYGINVKGVNYTDDSLDKAVALGFEWIKIYDHPPPERLPFRVLYRVNLPRPGENWAEWGHYRFLDAQLYADRIDAYEIGNEPNLIDEWGGPPDPAAYAELLAIAYREIRAADPDALIVSAGLAPVAITGHPHYVNDLAFLRGMYENGAAEHFDVLGVHPFGFAFPPEMPMDGKQCVPTVARPVHLDRGLGRRIIERACRPVDGLTFRRAEEARDIMVEYGDVDKPVWATEFGWVMRPPLCCRSRSDWSLRYWQVVSERDQADYILRAFAYARTNWPWMEAMFLWNLDYSRYHPGEDEECLNCESMGWYSILDPDGSPRLAYKLLAPCPP